MLIFGQYLLMNALSINPIASVAFALALFVATSCQESKLMRPRQEKTPFLAWVEVHGDLLLQGHHLPGTIYLTKFPEFGNWPFPPPCFATAGSPGRCTSISKMIFWLVLGSWPFPAAFFAAGTAPAKQNHKVKSIMVQNIVDGGLCHHG